MDNRYKELITNIDELCEQGYTKDQAIELVKIERTTAALGCISGRLGNIYDSMD